jgi:hypothetical protein
MLPCWMRRWRAACGLRSTVDRAMDFCNSELKKPVRSCLPFSPYWREFGAHYVTALCTQPDVEDRRAKLRVPRPPEEELEGMAKDAPPMAGAEYLTASVLGALWQELDMAFGVELAESHCALQEFLKRRNPAWNLVGRVHFHLAENRRDAEAPFAFLATYTTRLSARAKAQHLPLG